MTTPTAMKPADPLALLRTRHYVALLVLALAGLLVGLTIRYLPGKGGHSPADGFKPRGAIPAAEILGVFLAALATLPLGAVLGRALLLACKGLAYGVSMSSFRGGPTSPAMFLGAVAGAAMSHLPGRRGRAPAG